MALATEEEIDRLYDVPPEDFVAARNDLAKRLRETDRAASETVRGLRRPSPSAWALNRLVRTDRRGVERLVEAGDRLRAAQAAMLAGGSAAAFREAAARRREAVRSLADGAREALASASRAPGPHMDAITATLGAASVDPNIATQLLAGRLTTELTAAGDLDEPLGGDEAPRAGPAAPGRGRPDGARANDRRRAAAEADREAGRLKRDAERSAARAARARRAAEELRRRAAEAQADAVAAGKVAEAIRREADKARRRATRLAGGSGG
jgi:hypothetical protein